MLEMVIDDKARSDIGGRAAGMAGPDRHDLAEVDIEHDAAEIEQQGVGGGGEREGCSWGSFTKNRAKRATRHRSQASERYYSSRPAWNLSLHLSHCSFAADRARTDSERLIELSNSAIVMDHSGDYPALFRCERCQGAYWRRRKALPEAERRRRLLPPLSASLAAPGERGGNLAATFDRCVREMTTVISQGWSGRLKSQCSAPSADALPAKECRWCALRRVCPLEPMPVSKLASVNGAAPKANCAASSC